MEGEATSSSPIFFDIAAETDLFLSFPRYSKLLFQLLYAIIIMYCWALMYQVQRNDKSSAHSNF